MIRYFWFSFAVLSIGCSRRPATEHDAGTANQLLASPTVMLTADAGNSAGALSWMRQKSALAPGSPPKFEEKIGAPPDSRVMACVRTATDKQTLMTCFDALKVAPAHKPGLFGSVAPPIMCPTQGVPTWYYGPGGNNNNTCVTAGSPCDPLTGPMEIQERMGCGGGATTSPVSAQATTIQLTGNASQPAANQPVVSVWEPILQDTGSFTIACPLTQIGSGTLGTVTPKNRLAGQALTIDLGASASSYVNRLLINTTRNAQSYVDNIVSGNVVLMNQPMDLNDNEVDTYATNDSYTVQEPGILYLNAFKPICGAEVQPNYFPVNCAKKAQIQYCHIPAISHESATLWNIALSSVWVRWSYLGGNADLEGVRVSNSIVGSAHNWSNSLLIGGNGHSLFVTGVGNQYGSYFGNDAILHGTTVFPPGSISTVDAIAFDDGSSGPAFVTAQGLIFPGDVVQGSGVPEQAYSTNPASAPSTIQTQYAGSWFYSGPGGTAVNSFSTNLILKTDMISGGMTIDYPTNPSSIWNSRSMTLANIDRSVSAGGLGGNVFNSTWQGGFFPFGFGQPTPIPYQSQPQTAIGAPPTIPGLAAWHGPGNGFVNVSGANRVQYLSDQSKNSNDLNTLLGAGGGYGPIWNSTTKWMQFNGSDTAIYGGNPTGSTNTTTFLVVHTTDATANTVIWCSRSLQINNNEVGSNWGSTLGPPINSGVNIGDGLPHVLVLRVRASNDVDLFTDGHKVTATNGNTFVGCSAGELGGNGAGQQFSGYIGEDAFFTSLLTDDQVDTVDLYESGRWGIPITTSSNLPRCSNGALAQKQAGVWTCTGLPSSALTQVFQYRVPSPTQLAGLQLWLEPDVGVVLSGSNITTWQDQSGNSKNVTNSGNYPTYNASGGPNGLPQIQFNGSQTLKNTVSNVVSSGADRTIWALISQNGTGCPNSVFTNKLGTPYATFQYGNPACQYLYSDGATVNDTTGDTIFTGYRLVEYDYHVGSTVQVYVNGIALNMGGGAAASDTGTTGFQVGSNGGGQGFNGNIEEVVIVDHLASGTERNSVDGYIANKYGLVIPAATVAGWVTTPLSSGSAILTGTTPVVVSFTSLTANSNIQVTRKTSAGTPGNISAPSAGRTVGTSFTIVSDNAADTSTVDWSILN